MHLWLVQDVRSRKECPTPLPRVSLRWYTSARGSMPCVTPTAGLVLAALSILVCLRQSETTSPTMHSVVEEKSELTCIYVRVYVLVFVWRELSNGASLDTGHLAARFKSNDLDQGMSNVLLVYIPLLVPSHPYLGKLCTVD